MIIDFRARPPYKSFLKLSLYKPWRPLPEDPAEWARAQHHRRRP